MKKILFYLIAIMNIFHFSYAQYNGQKDLIQIDNDNEPQIIDVKWMNEEMTEEITQYKDGDIISLLVYTRNYEKGDTVFITVKAEYEIETGNKKEYLFKGVVDNDGYARLKAENKIES